MSAEGHRRSEDVDVWVESLPPASNRRTVTLGSLLSLLARTQPAEPCSDNYIIVVQLWSQLLQWEIGIVPRERFIDLKRRRHKNEALTAPMLEIWGRSSLFSSALLTHAYRRIKEFNWIQSDLYIAIHY